MSLEDPLIGISDIDTLDRAKLARKGHSVFLMEAGDDHGDELLQQIPAV